MTGTAFIKELSREECLAYLRDTTTVGRLAFVLDGRQLLLPVNFVAVDDVVYLRTAEGSVIAGLAQGHDEVAFEIDSHDLHYQSGWNVTVVGSTAGVDAIPEHEGRRRDPSPWAPGRREVLIALTPRRVDGRQVRSR